MPIISSDYRTPWYFTNPHVATIYASAFRKLPQPQYKRQTLDLPDGDFIDLDWSYTKPNQKSDNLVIVTHGLLGNSNRQYAKATALLFNKNGWDACVWNHRGMSGRPNRFEKMTTHGSTDELDAIVNDTIITHNYQNITLVGWSKGGNMALKYAGNQAIIKPKQISSIVAISAPIDIYGSVMAMGARSFYANRFKKKIYEFLKSKKELIDSQKFNEFGQYQTLEDFTEYYIAPANGFKNAKDYYNQCSSKSVLQNITINTLIINALDDPILSLTCSPVNLAQNSEVITLCTPKHGGHCAFPPFDRQGLSKIDHLIFDFAQKNI